MMMRHGARAATLLNADSRQLQVVMWSRFVQLARFSSNSSMGSSPAAETAPKATVKAKVRRVRKHQAPEVQTSGTRPIVSAADMASMSELLGFDLPPQDAAPTADELKPTRERPSRRFNKRKPHVVAQEPVGVVDNVLLEEVLPRTIDVESDPEGMEPFVPTISNLEAALPVEDQGGNPIVCNTILGLHLSSHLQRPGLICWSL